VAVESDLTGNTGHCFPERPRIRLHLEAVESFLVATRDAERDDWRRRRLAKLLLYSRNGAVVGLLYGLTCIAAGLPQHPASTAMNS
jgi:hypothetical protein